MTVEPGDPVPVLPLVSPDGERTSLAEHVGERPLIVSFLRYFG